MEKTIDLNTTTEGTARRTPPRVLVLIGACVANAMTGATYMWSIFAGPLGDAHSWTSSEVSMAYSGLYLVMCFSSFIAGTLQRKIGSKWIVLLGGASYAIAWASLALCRTLPELYLGFCLLGGIGSGFIYNTAVSTAAKWFPDKKGFANGMVIGATGLSPLVFAPLGSFLIESFGINEGPLIVGGIMLAAILVFSWFVQAPPKDYRPAGYAPTPKDEAALTGIDAHRMVRKPLFWMMLVSFFFCAIAGAMITGHAASIGMEIAGITAAQASLQVAALAIGNFCGRLGFGIASDRLGRLATLLVCMALTLVDLLFIMPQATSFIPFAASMIIVGGCYGGVMVVMPSLCGDAFGLKNLGQNYSLVFIGFNAASFCGPLVAASILDATGSYSMAFLVASGLAAVGMLTVLGMGVFTKRSNGTIDEIETGGVS